MYTLFNESNEKCLCSSLKRSFDECKLWSFLYQLHAQRSNFYLYSIVIAEPFKIPSLHVKMMQFTKKEPKTNEVEEVEERKHNPIENENYTNSEPCKFLVCALRWMISHVMWNIEHSKREKKKVLCDSVMSALCMDWKKKKKKKTNAQAKGGGRAR